jgi:hypothetical protein
LTSIRLFFTGQDILKEDGGYPLMFSLRGDAHKFYLMLKKATENDQPIHELKEVNEINEIRHFYRHLSNHELSNIGYRMTKEQKGAGIIPVFVTSLPWLAFIFSKKLQSWLFNDGSYLWIGFIFIYIVSIVLSIIVHYRERAWAFVHKEIIQDILKEREGHKDNI